VDGAVGELGGVGVLGAVGVLKGVGVLGAVGVLGPGEGGTGGGAGSIVNVTEFVESEFWKSQSVSVNVAVTG